MSSHHPVIMSREQRAKRRKAMADDIQSGMTVEDVVSKYGVVEDTVVYACREHKISPPRTAHLLKCTTFAILKKLLNGEQQSDIAREMKLSRQRVSQIRLAAIAGGFTELQDKVETT